MLHGPGRITWGTGGNRPARVKASREYAREAGLSPGIPFPVLEVCVHAQRALIRCKIVGFKLWEEITKTYVNANVSSADLSGESSVLYEGWGHPTLCNVTPVGFRHGNPSPTLRDFDSGTVVVVRQDHLIPWWCLEQSGGGHPLSHSDDVFRDSPSTFQMAMCPF